ncbi:MAG TPA: hypothetical protein VNR65_07985 [Geobacterales bacterium]|nr:hypothetical protein [Geobacterales bacterium]
MAYCLPLSTQQEQYLFRISGLSEGIVSIVFKKIFKKKKRKIIDRVYDFRFGRFEHQTKAKLLSCLQVNSIMSRAILSQKPFFVTRMGATECRICWNFARASFFNNIHSAKLLFEAQNNSGISSRGDPYLNRFASVYIGALPHADLIGLWDVPGMSPIIEKFGSDDLDYTPLIGLEPWSAILEGQLPWTNALSGKSVLVIHPFAKSIQKQYENRTTITTIRALLPEFELDTLVPPITFAGESNENTWVDNLQALMQATAARDFEVALIGCGAYGLPLGAFIKQLGRKAIHLGGVTQLLFGIKGNRWEKRWPYESLMDDTWVRPSREEKPSEANRVEDACYW